MNTFRKNLNQIASTGTTLNGATAATTTNSAVYDLFALGGAYRKHSDEDVILLFKEAYEENPTLALRCLFYLRDVRGGQGERRFFRMAYTWLADHYPSIAIVFMPIIAKYGRFDDLIEIGLNTRSMSAKMAMLNIIELQLTQDLKTKSPSLLAKWLPSPNTASSKTRAKAAIIRSALGLSEKHYRKILSSLRAKIHIVESDMSQQHWDNIDFAQLPSRAGMIYSNAFRTREETRERYEEFINSKNTKVNAATLYPHEIVAQAIKAMCADYGYRLNLNAIDDTQINALQKMWDNLPDYMEDSTDSILCVCDTSGSMTRGTASAPINVAIGLSMYCAERNHGPFHNCYVSFSSRPQIINIRGINFADKVKRIYDTNLCDKTDLEATFDLILEVAKKSNPADIPSTILIISDMQIDQATNDYWNPAELEMQKIKKKWTAAGIECPRLVYWNVNAYNANIIDKGEDVSFVSGFSPVILKSILSGKNGYDLMMDVLNSDRYRNIRV